MSISCFATRSLRWTACCFIVLSALGAVAHAASTPIKPEPKAPTQSPVLIAPVPQLPETRKEAQHQGAAQDRPLKVTEAQLLANPDLLQRAMLSVIQDENLPAIRILLPIYLKWTRHDPSIALYAQSLLDLNDGHLETAQKGFAALQRQFPKAVPIQYHGAQTLFLLGYYAEARTQMEDILRHNPGKFTMSRVGPYLAYLHKMTQEQTSFLVNAHYDPNINNAPDKRQFGDCQKGCFTFEKPKKTWVLDLNWQWQKQWFLPNRVFATVGYQWYNSWAVSTPEYNLVQLKFYQNVGVAAPNYRVYLQPFVLGVMRDKKAYSMSYGVEMAWQQGLGPRFGAQISQSFQYDRYWVQTFRNSYLYSLTLGQNWIRSDSQSFSFTQSGSVRVGTQSSSDSYWSYALGASWVQRWPLQIQSRLSAHYTKIHFMGPTLLTPTEDRQDKDYGVQLSLQYLPWRFWGLAPTLNFVWNRHWSNSPLYNYSSRNVNLSLSWSF